MTHRPVTRRTFLATSALTSAAVVSSAVAQGPELDVLIKGGTVVDGTGGPSRVADVGIRNGRIVAVEKLPDATAATMLDATGLVVSPGFIDVHAHTNLLVQPGAESKIFQGVTFDVTGPDGGSEFPRRRKGATGPLTPDACTTFAEWAEPLDDGTAIHLSSYIGHGALRELVLDESAREPTPDELRLMQDLVRGAMAQGAAGLSSGLEYNPAGFAKTEEVIALAKAVAEFGGVYGTHIRNEDDTVVESVDEAIRIAEESGATLLLTHLKVSGKPNWHKLDIIFEKIAAAQARGVNVTADRYPYLAWSTGLAFFYPGWSQEDGNFRKNLADPAQRARMRAETVAKVEANGGWETVMLVGGLNAKDRSHMGKRMDELAESEGGDPYDIACDLLARGNVVIVGFGMSESNTARIIKQPYCMIASDGAAMAARPGALGHPRSFGSFPRAIRMYVREQRLMPLEEMIRKMTSLPADTFRFRDRGRLVRGAHADIAVFDFDRLTDRATYLEPHQYAEGMRHVLVAGESVLKDGALTDARPGRAVARV